MKSIVFALLLSLLGAGHLYGQISINELAALIPPPTDTIAKKIVDTERYRIVYRMKHWRIPQDTLDVKKEHYLLQVGDLYTKYWPMSWAQADATYDEQIRSKTASSLTSANYLKTQNSTFDPESILTNIGEQKLTTRIHPRLNGTYEYEEPTPQLDWKLVSGDSTIAGYACRRAELHFRGRNFVAWYAPELDLSVGPVRFAGLPGLIFCIYDTEGYYHFELVGLEQSKTYTPIYQEILQKGLTKTTRQRAREVNLLCHQSLDAAIRISGKRIRIVDKNGKDSVNDVRNLYVPLELEDGK